MTRRLRRYWKHLVVGHLAAAVLALLIAFLAGVFATSEISVVFGQHLDKQGQKAYAIAERHHTEFGQRLLERLSLSKKQAAKATARNDAVSKALAQPHPLASPQPVTFTALVRNHSTRAKGQRVLLWVVHDAEMPNLAKLASLHAIAAWFNNPTVQASSNYATDAWGNTVLMVPCNATAKAWHVAWFNGWACGDELIGYATQKTWSVVQMRAAALLAARDSIRLGFPIQHGQVSGCTIERAGIVRHADLGGCGGGHHDPGTHFPLARFIALVKQYADAIHHPSPQREPKPKLLPRCTVKQLQAALNAHGARPRLAVDGIEGPATRAALKRAGALKPKGCHT